MQLQLEYEGAPLRYEKKQAYLARKIAERKAKSAGDTQEVSWTCCNADSQLSTPVLSVYKRAESCVLISPQSATAMQYSNPAD